MWNPFKRKPGTAADDPNPHNIRTTLFRRQQEETIKIQFLEPANYYNVDRDTVFPQIITPGIYELVKTTITAERLGPGQGFWYLFKGTRLGLTEVSLNRLIEQGKARIIRQ